MIRPCRFCPYCCCVLLFYSVTFLLVLPLVCNQMKFSIYYGVLWPRNVTKDTYTLKEDNNRRLLVALDHLRVGAMTNQTAEELTFVAPRNLTDIMITVITVSRKTEIYNPRYLTQTISKLIKMLKRDSNRLHFNYGLMVCNVDNAPRAYKEANTLSRLVHTVVKYKDNKEIQINRFEKEKQDYVYCLEESLMYHPKYVLLMEDDAYPTNRMLTVLEYGIQNIFEGKVSEFFEQRKNVAYLKLYHPERLLGFISVEIYRIFELAGSVVLLIAGIVFLNRKGVFKVKLRWQSILVAGVYIVLLALATGRQNLYGFRRLSKHLHSFVPAPSCCTPANLYSYVGACAMIKSFSSKFSFSGHAKDMLLDEFLTESGYQAIYVEPNIFQHIGQYSSLRKGSVLHPYVV